MNTLRPRVLTFFLNILLFTGCSNTQGYPGPEKASSEVAGIFFYSQKPLSLSEFSVDGQSKGVFDLGLTVLPGNHVAHVSFEIKNEFCDYTACGVKTFSGRCQIDVQTEAGRSYAVRVTAASDRAFIRAEDETSKEIAGSGTCATTGSRTEYKPTPRSS